MVIVRNIDRNGNEVDLSKITIRLSDFPIVQMEANRIAEMISIKEETA